MDQPRKKRTQAFLGILTFLTVGAFHPDPARAQTDPPFDLGAFLKQAAEYCRRLESVALHYTCREEIYEKIDLTRDTEQRIEEKVSWVFTDSGKIRPSTSIVRGPRKGKVSLVYDYQCIRNYQGAIRDTRTLIELNGKKVHVPEAKLDSTTFDFGTMMLGPTGIFAERFQRDHEYAVIGRERFQKKPAVVIDVRPGPGAPATTNLFGKAWIDAATGDILKIEWNESRVGHYEIFRERGENYGLKPKITITSEFSVEKNGLRFPKKLFIEEAYLNERGRKWVRSATNVEYTDFKFFTVEVEIK